MTVLMYHPEFAAVNDSFISLRKPYEFTQAVMAGGDADVLVRNVMVTSDELKLVHDASFVDAVSAGDVTNGYGNRDIGLVLHAKRSVALLNEGARVAMANNTAVCVPVQGFHHAHYDHCWGYCTFNGLMYTAMSALAAGSAENVLILDCDAHEGDGTADILRQLKYPTGVFHRSFEMGNYSIAAMNSALDSVPDGTLVIYQAGADAHIDDPMGAGYLTMAELAARDASVFTRCKARGLPVVWVLAGGYQDSSVVLQCHINTFNVCAAMYG